MTKRRMLLEGMSKERGQGKVNEWSGVITEEIACLGYIDDGGKEEVGGRVGWEESGEEL